MRKTAALFLLLLLCWPFSISYAIDVHQLAGQTFSSWWKGVADDPYIDIVKVCGKQEKGFLQGVIAFRGKNKFGGQIMMRFFFVFKKEGSAYTREVTLDLTPPTGDELFNSSIAGLCPK